MKYVLIVLVGMFLVFVGCRNYPKGPMIGDSIMQEVTVRGMPCIMFYRGNQAGITCDWGKYVPGK